MCYQLVVGWNLDDLQNLFVGGMQHVGVVEDTVDRGLDDSTDEVYIEDMVEKDKWNKVV